MREQISKRRGKQVEAGGRFKTNKHKGRPKAKQDVSGDGRKCGGAPWPDIKVAQQKTKIFQRREGKQQAKDF